MERTNSGFYVIDILPLRHSSKRPRHLSQRFKSRSPHYHYSEEDSAQSKREAFLEARRLKLAHKASHVRDVLMRNKQETLMNMRSVEKRHQQNMRVAERNRNRILQKQVQQCKIAVERAKEVSKLQHIKAEAEIERRKYELEKRLKTSEIRRAKLLRSPKSKLNAKITGTQPTFASYSLDEAATIIQQQWRRKNLDNAISEYRKLKLTVQRTKSMPFQDVITLVQSRDVISATSRLLQTARKMVDDGSMKKYKNHVRIFLSSYMLVSHPREILQRHGPTEEALLDSAKHMLSSFERWFNDQLPQKQQRHLGEFDTVWNTYYSLFESWKSNDQKQLVDNMIAHYVELDQMYDSVKGRVGSVAQWEAQVTEQRRQIKEAIAKAGGQAGLQRLSQVERRVNEARALWESTISQQQQPKRETVQTLSSSPPPSPPPLLSSPIAVADTLKKPSVVPVPTPVPQSSMSPGRLPTPESSPPSSGDVVTPTPEQLARLFSPYATPGVLTNEQLAHDIVMDPKYELRKPKRSDFEEQVRAVATKAFFESARQEFEQGHYDKWVPGLLQDCKDRLLELVPKGSPTSVTIEETLDIPFITQQLKTNVFDLRRCLTFITDTMRRLCAPVRDEEISDITRITDLATSFQRILEMLDLMSLDLANFRLRAFRPFLKTQVIEYERKKFGDALRSGSVGLAKTREWLKPAVRVAQDVATQRNPENVGSPDNRVRYQNIYDDALLSFIFSTIPIDHFNCPETLLLDVERLAGFQNEGQAINVVGALLMLARNFGGVALRGSQAPSLIALKDKLFILLQEETTIDNLAAEVIATVQSAIASAATSPASASAELPPDKRQLIRNMVDKTLSLKDTVFSLISRRAQSVIKAQLQTGTFKKESLASYGLELVGSELEGLSKKIVLLAKHNREVYAQWYDEIIADLLETRDDPMST